MYFPYLERLKTVLRDVQANKKPFHMNVWMSNRVDICGTACCAAGWGALDPVLQDAGLHLLYLDHTETEYPIYKIEDFTKLPQLVRDLGYSVIEFEGFMGYDATEKFFNITTSAALYLFDPGSYEDDVITPDMIIARINNVIACEGDVPDH